MQSISKFGIFQRRINPTLILTHLEPKSTKQAVVDPTWLTAVEAEYDALINNDTFTLNPLPLNRVPIGCKFGFSSSKYGEEHWVAVKRILRYFHICVCTTINYVWLVNS
ncbi:putative mitochondrial protein [Glycine soja]|nr:putative mitochondrial protein [Glycine max]